MSELFRPISTEQLAGWLFGELGSRDSAFGIPRQSFFVPRPEHPFRARIFGRPLDTPFGPAAGPHTQMAQNIVTAWLCGARYIELKTVQALDDIDVSKPCIDMQDEGYNVEWSQELKVYESFDEYLRAWVLIHALHHKLGFPGARPAVVFNMSVGYDLAGIRTPKMQWFLAQMRDCNDYLQDVVDQVARFYPPVRDIEIPGRLSDNVTLSTMHGCPPDEIGRIGAYLMQQHGLHTYVKCNPTLLGREELRELLNDELGYTDVTVPDSAFDHDLAYDDAVPMLTKLRAIAADDGLTFGVKLSNTLEVENIRPSFDPGERMAYLSGRPLQAITVNLASRLAHEFRGDLELSFSAGASCFNAPDLLACGMRTVTSCSDLLKTGGYLRVLDYIETLKSRMEDVEASSIDDFVIRSAGGSLDARAAALANLRDYAVRTRGDPDNSKDGFDKTHTKTSRQLDAFDCIRAPCTDECPLGQDVPAYMRATAAGDIDAAARVVRADNPIPCVLGRVCDHLCERACVRTHLDEPVAIRDIKRYIMDEAQPCVPQEDVPARRGKVAVIGAGPGGMAVALELARGGMQVEVFEQYAYGGGMVGGAVPEYRLPQAVFDRDFDVLRDLGVRVHYERRVGRDVLLSELRRDGFDYIVIMVGAQLSKTLGLPGEDCEGVVDALRFLRLSREDHALDIGDRVGIIGAGDTAMDCARVAWRQGCRRVTLIYRRTIDQMPADREEIEQLVEEGIEIVELAKPDGLVVEGGRLRALRCKRMQYTGERDESGRKVPEEIPGTDFEIPLDTLILAISQHAILDFFEDQPIALNERGYIRTDPLTFETSVPGIYAGGDVANEGPASIVKAAAAGKAIADSILQREPTAPPEVRADSVDPALLARRRARRRRRVPAPLTAPASRRNFGEVVQTYSPDQAHAEASRCLDCDRYCSICVGVCPNAALFTYQHEPVSLDLATPDAERNETRFRVAQPFQVAVLSDLCNECGNCATFCPTAGQPYRDKPRFYADRRDFEEQQDNAFLVTGCGERWSMDARYDGDTHHIELDGKLEYQGPSLRARIDPGSFAVEHAEPSADSRSLRACAEMFVLLNGVMRSTPFVPRGDPSVGRITHPGYED